jgi:hypothetical protein
MKRVFKFWFLAIIALCVGFSSCSKDEDLESIVGLWTYASYTAEIENPTYPTLEEEEEGMTGLASVFLAGTTIEFKSNQTFVMTLLGEETTGSWTTNGDTYIINFDGETLETDGTFTDGSSITVNGNVLTIIGDYLDDEYTYYVGEDGSVNIIGSYYDEEVNTTYRGAGFTVYTVKMVFKK